MKARTLFLIVLTLIFVILGINFLNAQVPQLLNYQGKLVKADGTPESGTFKMVFTIYSAESGGTTFWTETHDNVTVTKGIFNVLLNVPGSTFAGSSDRFLGIKVENETEMTPRFRLASVPYAQRAAEADGVVNNSITSTKIASGQVVKSINSLKDDVTIASGNNVTITPSGNTLTINASGTSLPDGSVTTVKIADNAVTSAKIQDGQVANADLAANAVTSAKIASGEVVKSINNLKDNVTLAAGSNISVSQSGNTITVAAQGVGTGDITAVNAGTGLSGGGASGDVSLSLNTSYTDGQYVNENQTNAINSNMVQDGQIANADLAANAVTSAKISSGQVVKSINTLKDDVILDAGSNISITRSGNTIKIAASDSGSGDITAVTAGNGLTGGAQTSEAILHVGQGDGITVSADAVSLNTSYADNRYVNEGQTNSIIGSMIQDGQIGNSDLAANIVTSDKIQDGTIGNNDILDEAGVAQASNGTNSITITTSIQNLISQTINVPVNGYVLVMGKCQGYMSHKNTSSTSVNFGVSNSATAFPIDQDNLWQIPSAAPSGIYQSVICTQKIFPVNAGTNTFYLLSQKVGGASDATIIAYDRTLSLVFFPTAYGSINASSISSLGTDDLDANQTEETQPERR